MNFRIEIILFNSKIMLSRDFDDYKEAKRVFKYHKKQLDEDSIEYKMTLFKFEV